MAHQQCLRHGIFDSYPHRVDVLLKSYRSVPMSQKTLRIIDQSSDDIKSAIKASDDSKTKKSNH